MDMTFIQWVGALGQVLLVVAVSFVVLCALTSLVRFQLMSERAMELDELGTGQEHEFRMVVMNQITAARRARKPITVLLLRTPPESAPLPDVETFLKSQLRTDDAVMVCGDNLVGILLMCGSEKSDVAARRAHEQAIGASIAGAAAWRMGVAGYPEHGYKTSEVYTRALTMVDDSAKNNVLITGMAQPEAVEEKSTAPSDSLDPVTGLISEDKMIGLMRRYIAQVRKSERPVSLIYFEIDQLDRVVAQYGKAMFDDALKELARLLDKDIRESDIIARFGQGGFVLTLASSPSAAMMVAQRIMFDVRKNAFNAGNGVKMSLSAGVAGYPDVIGTVVQYFVAAEAALQNARQRGKNQCVKYDRNMPVHTEDEKVTDHL